jgi:hypothetical protein
MAKQLSVWQQALKDAARELSMPKDSWPVERFATLRIALQLARSKWASGNTTASADLLVLMGEITTMRANAGLDVPRSVDVQIVKKLRGKCAHCGAMNEVPDDQIRAVLNVPGTPTATPEETATTSHDNGLTGAPTSPPPPPPPRVTHRPGVSASGFHNAVLPNGEIAPIKRATGRVVSPMSNNRGF